MEKVCAVVAAVKLRRVGETNRSLSRPSGT